MAHKIGHAAFVGGAGGALGDFCRSGKASFVLTFEPFDLQKKVVARFDLTFAAVKFFVVDEVQYRLNFPVRYFWKCRKLLVENAVPTFRAVKISKSDFHLVLRPLLLQARKL